MRNKTYKRIYCYRNTYKWRPSEKTPSPEDGKKKRYVILSEIIKNIPLDDYYGDMMPNQAVKYLKALRYRYDNDNNMLSISFRANRWDLSPLLQFGDKANGVFYFNNAPNDVRVSVKMFAIFEMLTTNLTLSSIRGHIADICNFFKSFAEAHPGSSCLFLTTQDILEHAHEMAKTEDVTSKSLLALAKYYSYTNTLYDGGVKTYIDVQELLEEGRRRARIRKKLRQDHKHPTIPDEYYLAIETKAIKVMRSRKAPVADRMIASMVVLESWVGLRPIELRLLEVGCMEKKTRNGAEGYFIRYISPKNDGRAFYVYCFDLAVEAYNTLLSCRKRMPVAKENKYLYVNVNRGVKEPNAPVTAQVFDDHYRLFIKKYVHDMATKEWDEYTPQKVGTEMLSVPSFYCYRVKLFNMLRENGFPPAWVNSNMSHLTSEMEDAYSYNDKERRRRVIEDYTEKFNEKLVQDTGTNINTIINEENETE